MSRYEWEQGEFTVPTAEWSRVKKEIRTKLNNDITQCFELAVKAYKYMSENKPKLRGYQAFEEASDFISRTTFQRIPESKRVYIMDRLFPKGCHADESIVRPTKKTFPLYNSSVEYVSESDCSLRFSNDSKKIDWYVNEGNHACDHAREGMIGQALFSVLGTVKWTRGSGGTIWGNDEYNQDSGHRSEGAGGSYQKGSYGPAKDVKSKTSSANSLNSSFRFR